MTSITPRASMRPLGRQPFRPGQWQGYKGASNNTTYIQNNFFGSGYNANMNYGNYNCNNCDNGGSNKFMNWMLGIGVGTTLLGGILKMFGVGGSDESGATDTETTTTTTATAPTTPTSSTVPTETTTPTTPTASTVPTEATAPSAPTINWNDVTNMVCTDASDKTKDISGKLTLGDNGEPPKSFTITDNTSGNVYKYELQEAKDGEKPVYKCVSRNGQPTTSKDNAYTLETENGKPKLVQHKGQGNYGTGLKFGALSSAGGGGEGTFSKTIKIYTSVGEATITVTGNSQKELDDKIAEREKESAKWDPKNQNKPESQGGTTGQPTAENPWASVGNGTSLGNTAWGQYVTKNTPASSATKTAVPKDVENWNKAHPDQQVSVTTVNGKTTYSTTAKIQTKFGVKTHQISGSSIEDLGKQIAELKKKAKEADEKPVGGSGNGYADLGRAMQH